MTLTRRARKRLCRALRINTANPTREQYRALLGWANEIVDNYEILIDVLEGALIAEVVPDGRSIGIRRPAIH